MVAAAAGDLFSPDLAGYYFGPHPGSASSYSSRHDFALAAHVVADTSLGKSLVDFG